MTTNEVVALVAGIVGIPGLGAGFWKLYTARREDRLQLRKEEREDRRELITAVKDGNEKLGECVVTLTRMETKIDSMREPLRVVSRAGSTKE